jgi:hypothetical protein
MDLACETGADHTGAKRVRVGGVVDMRFVYRDWFRWGKKQSVIRRQ